MRALRPDGSGPGEKGREDRGVVCGPAGQAKVQEAAAHNVWRGDGGWQLVLRVDDQNKSKIKKR